jgi:hypothetical protein
MIAEIITTDGEVIPSTKQDFYIMLLDSVPDKDLNDYFLKRKLLSKVILNHKQTNGSNGLSVIQLRSLFSFEEIEKALQQLQEKKQITKREGINHEIYFLNTKNK